MKKKNIAILVGIILVLIGVYFVYKLFCLNFYKANLEQERVMILEPYVLNHKNLIDSEYFKVGNISIKNEFENFIKEEETVQLDDNSFSESYQLKDGNKTKARISFQKSASYIDGLRKDATFLGGDKSDWLKKEVPKYMETKDFKSDYEFLKFLSNYQEPELNIFTPVSMMKKNFIVNSLTDIMLPECAIQELKGDYNGYILKSRDNSKTNFTEVNIEYKGYKYTIYFLEKDKTIFTESKIKELINSIKID